MESSLASVDGISLGHNCVVWKVTPMLFLAVLCWERIRFTSSGDGDIKIWNTRTRSPLFTMAQHTEPVLGLNADIRYQKIISGDTSGIVKVGIMFYL